MNYTEFDSYVRKWIFTHASMPVAEADLVQIKPFTQARSAQLWCEHVSSQSPDADHFEKDDWAFDKKIWSDAIDWQQAWDSDEPELPAALQVDIYFLMMAHYYLAESKNKRFGFNLMVLSN
jgi:hypothetical protein